MDDPHFVALIALLQVRKQLMMDGFHAGLRLIGISS
jgi:hypothetical protein